jgi:hypothetical protein
MMREMEAGYAHRASACARRTGGWWGPAATSRISGPNRTVEVGSTFYRPEARGAAVNPETKLLMLGHAFERGALRVQFTSTAATRAARRR